MNVTFIGGEAATWRHITGAARSSARADVAVAYFGEGGAKRLPLKPGSRLVVDASEPTVKSRATCPGELLKLFKQGVDIYSRPNLHAKVFVFPKRAYVGSANNTTPAASMLAEAVLHTTHPKAIRQARDFVVAMCDGVPLGPKELKKLKTLYEKQPTKLRGPATWKSSGIAFWMEEYDAEDYPVGSEDFVRQCVDEAKQERNLGHDYKIAETWRRGEPKYSEGDIIMMLNGSGHGAMMESPGKAIKVKQWSNGKVRYTFTLLEQRIRPRVSVKRLAGLLGNGWHKRLRRRGKLNRATGNELAAWWNERA